MFQVKQKKKKKSLLRPLIRFMFSRVVLVALLILVQIVLLIVSILRFKEYYYILSSAASLIAILTVCHIMGRDCNAGYRIVWIIVVLVFPPVGAAMYFLFSGSSLSRKTRTTMSRITSVAEDMKEDKAEILRELAEAHPEACRQSAYIDRMCMCPPYRNGETKYLPTGEAFLEALLAELEKAVRYIFLEYFIISHGEMWERICRVLVKKAAEGVDVRLIYDDFGSITRLSGRYPKELEAVGIRCRVFHPFVPVLSARQNNRDHRKICVIDGYTAFTGGINIGDEYINVTHPHGYWKDNAVLVRGEAAWSFARMFLTMWDYLSPTRTGRYRTDREPYSTLRPVFSEQLPGEGIVQPYTDNPLDNEPVGENVCLHILYHARRYVWITTPYLILDDQMRQALCTAATSGVDVRIVTPGIPDKKTVFETTRSNYARLLESGVRIYEYTPGFLHAKTFVCDDRYATVGSVNLDYRSLFLHFECGVWMYGTPAVGEIKADFVRILESSREITRADCRVSLLRRLYRSVLELFAPLL